MSTVPPRVFLLDVNVLLALAWPNHEAHRRARSWFDRHARQGWATTPITESGFVRISSNRRALPTSTTPALAGELLTALREQPGHQFWSDSVSLVTGPALPLARLTGYRQVTDAHLLALCAAHSGVLVTFNQGLAQLSPDPAWVMIIDE